ncbi:hypothetical protein [Lentzea sp. NPDC059081]|uniref:hypothetical protein n=1 Tax=Lentzea sp. NPDC059081 TaxID=3346719 RepID=UPI0036A8E965
MVTTSSNITPGSDSGAGSGHETQGQSVPGSGHLDYGALSGQVDIDTGLIRRAAYSFSSVADMFENFASGLESLRVARPLVGGNHGESDESWNAMQGDYVNASDTISWGVRSIGQRLRGATDELFGLADYADGTEVKATAYAKEAFEPDQ